MQNVWPHPSQWNWSQQAQSIVPHPVQGRTCRKTYPPSSSYSTGRRSNSVSQVGQEAEVKRFLMFRLCHDYLALVKHEMNILVQRWFLMLNSGQYG